MKIGRNRGRMESKFKMIPGLAEALFNIIPAAILVVDKDRRIHLVNRPQGDIFEMRKPAGDEIWRIGNSLNCIHRSDNPQGCGFSRACEECLIRNTAHEALKGMKTIRKKGSLSIETGKGPVFHSILVSATPLPAEGEMYALLFVEDITEVEQLKGLLPICANCKKIRKDDGAWERLEKFLESHSSVLFTHGICNECAEKIYGYTGDGKDETIASL